jgi:tonB-dependent receptor domain protein
MYMFEGLQIQNGLAGSLYGGQDPAGIFNYTRKRPIPFSNTFWADYTSRSNFGIGWDTSDRFEHVGYRGVFYKSDVAKQAKNSNYERNLASLGLDFYLTENFTIETNFSYYKHKILGNPGGFSVPGRNGVLNFAVPDAAKNTKAGLEQEWAGSDLKTTTASVKFKYAPTERWYFEGGYQWQKPSAICTARAKLSRIKTEILA